MAGVETANAASRVQHRPISPFRLEVEQENCLQTQIASIVQRLDANEERVRSVGECLEERRRGAQTGLTNATATEVPLGKDSSASERNSKSKPGVSSTCATNPRELKRPSWTRHSPAARKQTSGGPLPLHDSANVRKDSTIPHGQQAKEVVGVLRELSRRSDEVHCIRRQLRFHKRHATESAAEAEQYRRRQQESESRLASMSGECQQLRNDLVKVISDTTEVDVEAMVADTQCSIVQLRSEVEELSIKVTDAETGHAAAIEDGNNLRGALDEKEECLLVASRKLDMATTDLATTKKILEKAEKERKGSAREADVWQQKCLALGREGRRQEELLKQADVTVRGLQKRILSQERIERRFASDKERILDLERQLAEYDGRVRSLQEEMSSNVKCLEDQVEQQGKALEVTNAQILQGAQQRKDLEFAVQEAALSRASLSEQYESEKAKALELEKALQNKQLDVDALAEESQRILAEKSALCDEVNQTLEQMAKEHDRWQEEIALLRGSLQTAEGRAEHLQQENSALKNRAPPSPRLADVSLDTHVLQVELRARSEEKHLQIQIAELKRQLDGKAAECRSLHDSLQNTSSSYRDLRTAMKSVSEEAHWKNRQIADLQTEQVSLRQELTVCRDALHSVTVDSKVERVGWAKQSEAEIASLSRALKSQHKRTLEAESRAETLDAEWKKCQSTLAVVKKERQSATVSVADLEAQCSQLREGLAALQTQARLSREESLQHSRQLRQNLQTAKQKGEAAESKLADTTQSLASFETRLQQRAAQVSSLQEQLKAAKKVSAEKNSKLDMMGMEVDSATEKLTSCVARERQAREREDELLSSNSRLHQTVKSVCKTLAEEFLAKPRKQNPSAGPEAVLESTTAEAVRAHRQLKRKHVQITAEPVLSCSSCVSRLPTMQHKLEKAQVQAAEAKRMLQASRRMLQHLVASSAEQQQAYQQAMARMQHSTA